MSSAIICVTFYGHKSTLEKSPVPFVDLDPHLMHCVPTVQAAKAARLEKFEMPAKIILLAEPWTPESGLVTAALKLKREQLKTKFKDDLNKLYL